MVASLASLVMNSKQEAGLMCNVASGGGTAYVTGTADLVKGRRGRGWEWEQCTVGRGNMPRWLFLIR